jgi:hypothetical protein
MTVVCHAPYAKDRDVDSSTGEADARFKIKTKLKVFSDLTKRELR